MRSPFRFALPDWFGDPGPQWAGHRAAALPLWRRTAHPCRPCGRRALPSGTAAHAGAKRPAPQRRLALRP
jgi:hypothetical protein